MDFLHDLLALVSRPWPWYVAGPLIGLVVPLLLLVGNKQFGISANLRHACAIVAPGKVAFFRYDWRGAGGWNLAFVAGVLLGGFIAGPVARERRADHAVRGHQGRPGRARRA